jgi:hypothetical protein
LPEPLQLIWAPSGIVVIAAVPSSNDHFEVKEPQVGKEFDANSWLLFCENPAKDGPVVIHSSVLPILYTYLSVCESA